MNQHSTGPPRRDTPGRRRRSPWRRRAMWAAALLLPLAVGFAAYSGVWRWLDSHELVARNVVANTSASFGGATWELEDMHTLDLPAKPGQPSIAMAVVTDFSVRMHTTDLSRQWRTCRIELVDDQGRRWSPSPIIPSAVSRAGNCPSAALYGVRPGTALRVREIFVVPRAVAHIVTATLSVDTERPYYLRFDRPRA